MPLRALQHEQEAGAMTSKGALSPRPPAETHVQTQRDKFLMDVGAWAGNVSTSVLIVFVNKVLLKNYAYHYATTLVSLPSLMASRQGSGQAASRGSCCRQGPVAAHPPQLHLRLPPNVVPCRLHCTSWCAPSASGLRRRAA